jgi:hypothetical protein
VHKNPAAFSFLQSDNQKKEEGYPIARKEKSRLFFFNACVYIINIYTGVKKKKDHAAGDFYFIAMR